MGSRLPDVGGVMSLPELVERLRVLKVWAGDPSYETITSRINAAWTEAGRPASELTRRTTVADCFRPDRRRLNVELVLAVVEALHPAAGYVAQWRQAFRVVGGETQAAAQVRVQAELPGRFEAFSGRAKELDLLGRELPRGLGGPPDEGGNLAVLVGMAGVGKTQLAVQTGYRLVEDAGIEQVLHVNLRGFHPDVAQPPADPAAVLDGFLRLLGLPGGRIPLQLEARAKLYQEVLADRKVLVLLDNATSEEQIRLLLPRTPGSLSVVTSRHSLVGLPVRTRLTVDGFTPEESRRFLAVAVPDREVGSDPRALERIAELCGHLPLALGLVAGHICSLPGWTLTDHADRLAERHQDKRLDADVEIAFRTSYQSLTDTDRRLLRLVALDPGQDFDAYAAAALCDLDLATAEAHLECLRRDHLLVAVSPGRYTLHDLIRTYARSAAIDEEPPPARRAALTRLFDYYLATAMQAVNVVHPDEAGRRPVISPPDAPVPRLDTVDAALGWLDTERPNLVAMADHCVREGWCTYPIQLSVGLYRHLEGASTSDALSIFRLAHQALRFDTAAAERGQVLTNIGHIHRTLGQNDEATKYLRQARAVYRDSSDPGGEATVLHLLGGVELRRGEYQVARRHTAQALALFRQADDLVGTAKVLNGLALIEERMGRTDRALVLYREAVELSQESGVQLLITNSLNDLGDLEGQLGRFDEALAHLRQALDVARAMTHRVAEGTALEGLGTVLCRMGDPLAAIEHCRQALQIHRRASNRHGLLWTLNSLGEATTAARRPKEALAWHVEAEAIAIELETPDHLVRARTGLAEARRSMGDLAVARTHCEGALAVAVEYGLPDEERIRRALAALVLESDAQSRPFLDSETSGGEEEYEAADGVADHYYQEGDLAE